MSPHSGRNATAQAGFPKGRDGWLIGIIMLTVVIAAVVIVRGPYGRPLSGVGAGVRTLGLLLLAAAPGLALAWAWKRLPRWGRRTAPIPIGVLTVMLALMGAAHGDIYSERVRMSRDAATLAGESFTAGDRRFWAVEDSMSAITAPPVANRCIMNKHGVHVIPGTSGMTVNAAHRRYRDLALTRARQYNEAMIARLRISPEEVRRVADSFCPD
ncbi:MAG TPA: hypothetical protein VGC13_01350 [Longimicrobium sp.]|jgi:hypothetical protein|uniref:hypothetical protein n=1 Tax=Longimicrobium sp. TaxID=2029185 RepID=UPI002ED875FD